MNFIKVKGFKNKMNDDESMADKHEEFFKLVSVYDNNL